MALMLDIGRLAISIPVLLRYLPAGCPFARLVAARLDVLRQLEGRHVEVKARDSPAAKKRCQGQDESDHRTVGVRAGLAS